MTTSTHPNQSTPTFREILTTWLPLAGSWLLMAAELPALSIFVARLANPEIHLAAYGGVVFPLALIIESPIIMLLAASTALSKDQASYDRLRRYMIFGGAALTTLHALIAFTPLYYFVVESIIGAPAEIVEPARVGLRIMLPWTWAIAYRRFKQGVMIRFNQSWAVTVGTAIRLTADVSVLTLGLYLKNIPGIVVATGAVATGVVSEANFAGLAARPVVKGPLRTAPPVEPPLTRSMFLQFYIPLATTSLLALFIQPMGSAAISRMPQALESLAVWPVVIGLSFVFRSTGVAYNEVVVALLERPNAYARLRRFTGWLTALVVGLQFILVATPLADFWLRRVTALSEPLSALAHQGLWFGLLLPGFAALQSWYQGAILNSRETRAITEAVVIFLIATGAALVIGVAWGAFTGLYVAMLAYTLGMGVQTAWLWWRSRGVMADLRTAENGRME